jgi:hypothetical protein
MGRANWQWFIAPEVLVCIEDRLVAQEHMKSGCIVGSTPHINEEDMQLLLKNGLMTECA